MRAPSATNRHRRTPPHPISTSSLAIARLKPLAAHGGARAHSYVGSMYEGSRGVKRDYSEAIRWCLVAAEQGDAYSQSRLGILYEKGHGAERDEKLAARWYAKAA